MQELQRLQQRVENLQKQLETTQKENKMAEKRLSEIEIEKEKDRTKFLEEMIKNTEDRKVAVQSVEAERDNRIVLLQCHMTFCSS